MPFFFFESSCWVIYRTATSTAFHFLIFFPIMISIHPRKGQYCLQSVRLLIPKDSRQSLKTKISIPFKSWDGLLAPQLQWLTHLCTHYRSKRKKIAQKLFNYGQKAPLCAFFFFKFSSRERARWSVFILWMTTKAFLNLLPIFQSTEAPCMEEESRAQSHKQGNKGNISGHKVSEREEPRKEFQGHHR